MLTGCFEETLAPVTDTTYLVTVIDSFGQGQRAIVTVAVAHGQVVTDGRRAVRLESQTATVAIDLGGGSIVDFHLGGAGLNPLRWLGPGDADKALRPMAHDRNDRPLVIVNPQAGSKLTEKKAARLMRAVGEGLGSYRLPETTLALLARDVRRKLKTRSLRMIGRPGRIVLAGNREHRHHGVRVLQLLDPEPDQRARTRARSSKP